MRISPGRRTILFAVTGAIASAASVAYAAAEVVKGQDGTQIVLAVAVIFGGLAQLGSTGLLVKRYMGKVDKLSEGEPALISALDAHKAAMESHSKSIKDLYESRNIHQDNLTEINTLHETKGCWNPKRKTDRRKRQTRKDPVT